MTERRPSMITVSPLLLLLASCASSTPPPLSTPEPMMAPGTASAPLAPLGPVAATPAASTRPLVYVAGYGGPIGIFRLDATAGALQEVGRVAGGESPSYLAFGPRGRVVYAANEVTDGRVTAFSVRRQSGALERLGDAPAGGFGPAHISVDRSGRWLLVANYAHEKNGTIAVLPIRADGGLGAPVSTMEFGHNANPHQIVADAGNRHLFVPCKGLDSVAQLRFDPESGKVTPNVPGQVATAKGAGPRHMDFHPGGKLAFVINEQSSTMTAYRYDPAAGRLAEVQTVSTLPAGWSGKNSCADVHVHPSGRFLYGSNRGHDSIAIFAIDQATGRLTLVGHEARTIKVPRNFHVDPTGALLLVASQAADTVSVFRINPTDGTLALQGEPTVVAGFKPSFVGVLPSF